MALQFFITTFTSFSSNGSILIFIINNLIGLIVNILLGLLVSGKAYLYMNLLYSQPVSTSDIFFGMKQQPQKAVLIQAFFAVIDFALLIPIQVILSLYQDSFSYKSLQLLVVFVLFALIVNIAVSLIYSQAFFLLHDFPERSARELLATSRRLMRGNKMRFFYLNIGFIPLYILGTITLFIPILWISVYRYASVCSFYQDLIATASASYSTGTEET